MRRLLVTGRHGFVGQTVARLATADPSRRDWELAAVPPHFDILDRSATESLVEDSAPDAVLHLAAQSSVADSWQDPQRTLEINVIGTLRLLEALKGWGFGGPMVFVSSGDVYGLVPPEQLPIRETALPAPRNPYAVSKLAAEALCYQWAVTHGMRIVVARPFNHIGPGQSERFAVASFAAQLAAIRRGERPPVIEVGDVEVTRDFTDVRDIVAAYFALLERGDSGERYNVCAGREHTLRELLDTLIELAGVEVEVRQDAARLRPAEQRRAVGDPSKLYAATGWRATTPLRDSLAAVLRHFEDKT